MRTERCPDCASANRRPSSRRQGQFRLGITRLMTSSFITAQAAMVACPPEWSSRFPPRSNRSVTCFIASSMLCIQPVLQGSHTSFRQLEQRQPDFAYLPKMRVVHRVEDVLIFKESGRRFRTIWAIGAPCSFSDRTGHRRRMTGCSWGPRCQPKPLRQFLSPRRRALSSKSSRLAGGRSRSVS